MSNANRTGSWVVAWSNPYRVRPDGFPLVLLRVSRPLAKGEGCGPVPPEVQECWEEMWEYGYAISWLVEEPPARTLPLASKQRLRRLNLWKRLLKRYPMFTEAFYIEQVHAQLEYYGPLIVGEFANVEFARSVMGGLKMVRNGTTA